MKLEDKQLLFKDLCARLPYGVIVYLKYDENTSVTREMGLGSLHDIMFDSAEGKPYLRPMSSMTEEECVELSRIRPFDDEVEAWKYIKTPVPLKIANTKHFDFFHSHHLDWRGLIEKGLALKAPEVMYN